MDGSRGLQISSTLTQRNICALEGEILGAKVVTEVVRPLI